MNGYLNIPPLPFVDSEVTASTAPSTGGPAFPFIDGASPLEHPGMTLRDYFAAKATAALITTSLTALGRAHVHDTDAINPTIAKAAYEVADAMLKARSA